MTPPALSVNAVDVSIGSRQILKSVSLDLEAGELVALTGRSGAGKSTLLNAISGLVEIASGDIWLGNTRLSNLAEPNLSRSRRRIGFVYQDATLFDEMSVARNVEWAGRLRGLARSMAQQEALHILELLEIEDLASKRPGQISGGEAQRVNIARALIGDVSLLLVDEPTASLDERTANDVCRILRKSVHGIAAAALVVSHDPIVVEHSDRQLRMIEGAILN